MQATDPAALGVLTTLAGDLDVGVRRRAIAALVHAAPEPAGGAWGLRGRWDPSPYVQRSMITALAGRVSEPETRTLLNELVTADIEPYTRGYAALVLVQATQQTGGNMAELAGVLGGEARKLRRWSAGSLYLAAALAGNTEAAEVVLQLLSSGEAPLEREFFEALYGWQEPRLKDALQAGIPKMEFEVAGLAAGVLLNLDPGAGGAWFSAALLQSSDEELVLDLVDLLRELPNPAASQYLNMVQGEWAPDLAGVALVARGERPLKSLKRWLVPGKEGLEDAELAMEAARAAAAVWKVDPHAKGSEQVVGWLEDLSDKSDVRLREAVVAALGMHGEWSSVRARLTDPAQRVQLAAAEALVGVR